MFQIPFLRSISRPMTERMLLDQYDRRERRRRFFKTYSYLSLCALLPALIMLLIYVARGLHPIGDGSVLVLDLTGQYVWFFEGLRNTVYGDASMLYTFARALGGEFLGIFAYYIASPLSYIVCLFPQDRMLEALLTLFLLKVGISGATFGFYMHRTLKERKPTAVIIFSIFYALSAYAVVQQHNTMWIDALMWLPLLTLGMEELIKRGKFKMYTIFLALTIFSNFYIGYMICVYCAIYFFLYYLAHAEEFRSNPLHERCHFVKSLVRIALYSILALGIAAIVIIGAYYSLNFGKTTFSTTKWEFLTNFDLLDLFYKFLPGSYDTVRPEGLPFVYCGMLTLLFLPAYFLSKKYPMRQKIVSGVLVILFVLIATLNITDLIMHGFQAPNWLNYRYSFMLSFYLCVLACRAFACFESVPLRSVAGTAGLIALLCVILQKYSDDAYVDPNDYTTIWFSLLLIFIYLSAIAILRTSVRKRLAAFVLVLIVCFESFVAGLIHIGMLNADVGYSGYSYYNDFLDDVRPIVEQVRNRDRSFYRMEKTVFRSTNDNMALQMRGLSGSTSTLNKETIQFLNKMGYSSVSHWSKYLGGTPVNDSLLGIKYVVSDNDIYMTNYGYTSAFYDPETGYAAYRNPYALSIAYGVDDALLDFALGYTNKLEQKEETDKKTEEETDVVEIKQVGTFFDTFKAKLNELLGIEETLTTSDYIDPYISPFERLNAIMTAMVGAEELQEVFVAIPVGKNDISTTNILKGNASDEKAMYYQYQKASGDDTDAVLTYTITVPKSGEVYFYLPTDYPREMELSLFVHGTEEKTAVNLGEFFGNETTRIFSIGTFEAGTTISLDMTLLQNVCYVAKDHNAFYYIDYNAFERVINTLKENQLVVTDYTEDEIHGTFTTSKEHQTVFTTLAYDKGWKVYVDGKEVKTVKALGALIAFEINGEAGAVHSIDLVYKPNTVMVGLSISLISAILLLLLILFEKQIKRVPVLRSLVTAVPRKGYLPTDTEQEDSNNDSQDPPSTT